MAALLVASAAVALIAWAGVGTLRRPGPTRPAVAIMRYGVLGYAAALTAAGLATVALFMPRLQAPVGVAALTFGAWVGTSPSWLRRARIRCIWPSACRAAGLATKDRRGSEWPLDATLTIGDEAVEWLPVIMLGRALAGGRGVRWQLRPARGASIQDVADRAEELAAALHVGAVRVERITPHRGELVVLWRPPFAAPVLPGDLA